MLREIDGNMAAKLKEGPHFISTMFLRISL